jgi:hypothetical protein
MISFSSCHFIVYTKYRIDINHLYNNLSNYRLYFNKNLNLWLFFQKTDLIR